MELPLYFYGAILAIPSRVLLLPAWPELCPIATSSCKGDRESEVCFVLSFSHPLGGLATQSSDSPRQWRGRGEAGLRFTSVFLLQALSLPHSRYRAQRRPYAGRSSVTCCMTSGSHDSEYQSCRTGKQDEPSWSSLLSPIRLLEKVWM